MNKHIYLAALLLLFTACNKEMKFQESWITNELEARTYNAKSQEVVRAETERILDYCTEQANKSLKRFEETANEEIRRTATMSTFLGFDELYGMMGTSAGEVEYKKAKATIDKYVSNSEKNLARLRGEVNKCLLRENAGMMGQESFSDDEIFYGLIGTPAKPAKPSDMEVQMYAETIMGFTILNMSKPAITNISYDKGKECWYVRMDGYDDQYVRFTKRNDGDYDINYGSTIGDSGYPEGESVTISANYRPTVKKEADEVEEDRNDDNSASSFDDGHALANPKSDMFIGLWETEDNYSKINITSTYFQLWYDSKRLAEEGSTGMAKQYKGKTVFDCTRQKWYLQNGLLNVTDGEYLYDSFAMDKSKKFIYRPDMYEVKYYKQK